MKLYKKAQQQGMNIWVAILTPVITMFIMGILTIIGYYLITNYHSSYATTGLLSTTGDTVFTKFTNAILMFDLLAVIIMSALMLGISWSISQFSHHPIEYVAAWIMAPFLGFIGYIFNYIFIKFIEVGILQTASLMFPKITILATNLHWVALATFILCQIMIYLKGSREKGGNIPSDQL